ncbi:hypothetical protein N0V94_003539 [Neodidymelliopsis sp. IMI 364377]|nr:hypothetical protein N0V94_003539 [Neodidymelliopsis sp. IMI 364377]
MAATGMPLFYTDQQPQATHLYLSQASTIVSDPSLSWNMAPHQEINAAAAAITNNGSGELSFIVGNSPAELRSKKNMTIVRKQAMQSFLKTDKKVAKKPRGSSLRSEESFMSQSSIGSQDEFSVDAPEREEEGNGRRQSSTALSTVSRHGRQSSSPEAQMSSVRVLEASPIVLPSRTNDRGQRLPYDREKTPLFASFGEGVDPFGTMFQSRYKMVSVEKMKFLCSRFFGTRAMGQHWVPTVLSSPHTFLSTLCVASSHLDAILERNTESIETLSLRQEIMHLIDQNIAHPSKKIDDLNITALIQLIAGEVIGREEGALRYHERGITTMIECRGGLNDLGVSGYLASTISWTLLESAILREERPRAMYSDYCTSRSTRKYPIIATIPESPIYHPRHQFETLKKSKCCSRESVALLDDVHAMIELFLHPTKSTRRTSRTLLSFYKDITTKYRPISELRGANDQTKDDFKYEAIRITAILVATAMIRGVPLSKALPYAAATTSTQLSSLYAFTTVSHTNEPLASPTSPLDPRHDSMTSYTTSSSYAASLMSEYDPSRSSISSETTSHPSISSSVSYPSFSSIATSHSSISSIAATRPSINPLVSRPHKAPTTPFLFNYNPFHQNTLPPTQSSSSTFLQDFKVVLESSNMSECWQDMAGVLLWIALTVGAASRQNENKVLRKWYSALSMRASVLLCFEHPEVVHATMLKMGQVVEALGGSDVEGAGEDVEGLVRRNSAAPGKKRRIGE